jgi:hypothetical protein
MFAPPIKAAKSKIASRGVLTRSLQSPRHIPWRSAADISDQAMLWPPSQRADSESDEVQKQVVDRMRIVGRAAGSSLAWDFSKTSLFPPARASQPQPPAPLVQSKLAIGQANDPLEHEADRIADQVMQAPTSEPVIGNAPLQLSRMCADCKAEDEAQMLQTKRASMSEPAAGYALDAASKAIGSPGQPLDASARTYFEPRFAYDFSQVRIHSDGLAHDAATAVNAKAYTVGSHVVFAAGQYAPHAREGRQLLAHELTHVVQQSGGKALRSTSPVSTAVIQRQMTNQREGTPAKTKTPVEEDCGTGEVEGHVQICCMPHERQHVKECDDLFSDVLFECWDKGPQDAHHLDVCGGKARFAECRCLASRLGPQHCRCGGLV